MLKLMVVAALFSLSFASVVKRQTEDVKSPEVKLPDLKIPDLKLPDFSLASASLLPAKCPPKPETVADLDIDRYSGKWYQALALPSFFQPNGTQCIRAAYTKTGDNSISIWNSNVRPDGTFYEICGSADIANETNRGEFTIKFSFSPAGSNMLVLDTDYDNFAAVYSCIDFPVVGKFEYAWVLSRESKPSEETVEAGRQALASKGISIAKLEVISHGADCIYEKEDGTSCSKTETEKKEFSKIDKEVKVKEVKKETDKKEKDEDSNE